MKLPASISLPILALSTSFSLAFAQSNFCFPNIVYVTVTPTTTVTAAEQTCGLTIYTTKTQTATVTIQPFQAVESSSAAGTSVAPVSSVYVSSISDAFVQGTFSFALPSSSSEAVVQSSSVVAAAANENTASATPSSAAPLTTVISSATSASAAVTAASTSSSSTALSSSNSGQATFYGGNVSGGMCSFSTYTLPSGIYGTALSDSNWDDAGNCGACISVTGPSGNSIKAMIVDQCPGCGTNHLDLFPDAFAALANPTTGVIDVTWSIVPCGISTPLSLHNKDGTSQYWFSMQVVNANIPVASLEVSTDGGASWQATTRQDYNFFENASGFGTETVDVRVTSETGEVVTVNNVSVASGTEVTASGNFA